MLCVGIFGVGFGGVIVCCVWDCLEWIWASEFVLCLGLFEVGWGSECVLFVGLFGVDLCE